jgi:hypothetical protein
LRLVATYKGHGRAPVQASCGNWSTRQSRAVGGTGEGVAFEWQRDYQAEGLWGGGAIESFLTIWFRHALVLKSEVISAGIQIVSLGIHQPNSFLECHDMDASVSGMINNATQFFRRGWVFISTPTCRVITVDQLCAAVGNKSLLGRAGLPLATT